MPGPQGPFCTRSNPPRKLYTIACLVALTVTAICVVKMFFYYGPIALEADPYDRYTVFAESIRHGTLRTGIFDHQLPEGLDPYEPNGRKGIFWWDFSYYKGKQYHYASFLPALLFNIPFKALFGFYPGPKLQVIFSTFLAVFSVSLLILRFLEVYVADRTSYRSLLFRWSIFLFCLPD